MSSTRTHSPADPLDGELSDTLSCDGDIETEHTGAGPDIADIDISRLALPVRGYKKISNIFGNNKIVDIFIVCFSRLTSEVQV